MVKRDVARDVSRLLEKLRYLADLQTYRANHSTQGAWQYRYTGQKSLLVHELGKHLRAWAKEAETRVLISVPIVHTKQVKRVARSGRARISKRQSQIRTRTVAAFWRDLSIALPNLRPDKVYQDGLPVYDERPEMVTAIVDREQTPNVILLRALRDQGSEIMGTESLSLVLQQIDRLARGVSNVLTALHGHDEVLQQRDASIVDRITQTLRTKEVGMLLIGAVHRIVFPKKSGIWKIDLPTAPGTSLIEEYETPISLRVLCPNCGAEYTVIVGHRHYCLVCGE